MEKIEHRGQEVSIVDEEGKSTEWRPAKGNIVDYLSDV